MKKLLILYCLILSSNFIFGQITKEVENGIFVTFPTNPEYTLTSKSTSYSCKTDNCMFMVIMQKNIIPNYEKYLASKKNWSAAEIKTVEDSFLDSAVKGKLDYTGNEGQVIKIRKGPFNAREVSYSAINPATGERGKRFSTIILVRDKLVSFEVFFLLDNSSAEREKNLFLESISVKTKDETKTIKGNNLSKSKNVGSNSEKENDGMEEEELIQSGQGTTENVITEEGKKILASAKRKALEQKVNPSIYGTDSSQRGSGGIDYKYYDGGKYAEVAEAESWSKWSYPDNMDARLEAYNKSKRNEKYMKYGSGIVISLILLFIIVRIKRYKSNSNSNKYSALKKNLKD